MKIALFGNPNTGKSTVFNLLTGLRQKIGNFPGVTVEQKSGEIKIQDSTHELIDIPGTYSIYPANREEEVVYQLLTSAETETKNKPELGLLVADASNLSRSLFLFSQLIDCNLPLVLVINMQDLAEKKGIKIDLEALQESFPNTPIIMMNARVGLGKDRLIQAIGNQIKALGIESQKVSKGLKNQEDLSGQEEEARARNQFVEAIIGKVVSKRVVEVSNNIIDYWLTHPFFGYIIFGFILLVIFQFVYALAAYPMEAIELGFAQLSIFLHNTLPNGVVSELICNGLIPGISGVLVFIPQIAILFFFIALLEDSGYLARAVFIMDRLVRPFGLNGRSVVPLLSSLACAIPGIMATRGIPNNKERIITIFVSPLMSCSARIPVFTLLIALVIPQTYLYGFIQLQGLVLFGLYLLGIIAALLIAWILHVVLKQDRKSYYIMEIPSFKKPLWRNIGFTVYEKVKVFTLEAGSIILAISIILWALANYGPNESRKNALKELHQNVQYKNATQEEKDNQNNAILLENSYIGILGKTIEPAIKPLGYDWKIGISLITSFAAREVFVGSLSTIYSTGNDPDEKRLTDKLREQRFANGERVFTLKAGISLMVFYVFAMQCLSTLAVVKRETRSWKWPIIQLISFGAIAYIAAYFCFNLF